MAKAFFFFVVTAILLAPFPSSFSLEGDFYFCDRVANKNLISIDFYQKYLDFINTAQNKRIVKKLEQSIDQEKGISIGVGAYGAVSKHIIRDGLSKKEFAVKSFETDRIVQSAIDKANLLKNSLYFPKFFGVITHKNKQYLIYELLGEDLENATFASARERKKVVADIFKGVLYLHQQGFAHSDIGLRNLMVDKAGNGKIIDLDLMEPLNEKNAKEDIKQLGISMLMLKEKVNSIDELLEKKNARSLEEYIAKLRATSIEQETELFFKMTEGSVSNMDAIVQMLSSL